MRPLVCLAFLTLSSGAFAQLTVINGASFNTTQPVAAGSWVTAFGSFTGVVPAQATALPLPKTLGGVTVTVDGTQAPLYYVSPTQINFILPAAVQPGRRNVEVRAGAVTVSGTVQVMVSGPGLFMKETTTGGLAPKGAVLNQDSTENTVANPARRGQVVSIYATGPGTLAQSVADGEAAPTTSLVHTTSTPQVFIGGVEAQVQFSGLAPGLVAVWQVNVFVPQQSFLTGRVPVQVYMNGVDSNEVSIFVAQ